MHPHSERVHRAFTPKSQHTLSSSSNEARTMSVCVCVCSLSRLSRDKDPAPVRMTPGGPASYTSARESISRKREPASFVTRLRIPRTDPRLVPAFVVWRFLATVTTWKRRPVARAISDQPAGESSIPLSERALSVPGPAPSSVYYTTLQDVYYLSKFSPWLLLLSSFLFLCFSFLHSPVVAVVVIAPGPENTPGAPHWSMSRLG